MHNALAVLVMLLVVVALVALMAPRLRLPYPILLAAAGLGVSAIPGLLPRLPLDPDLILLIFLPPLLYADAFDTSWVDFRRWLRPILMLAIGLVAFTTLAVGLAAKACFPDLPWAACFVLGAIVSPTDTVAAQAVIERLRVPRRITAILGGESLVNDATGLVGVQLGVAVALTGVFRWAEVGRSFAWVAGGGIAVGLAAGLAFAAVNRRVRNPAVLFIASLLAPYAATLAAVRFEVSAVLAVVTAGFFVAWRVHTIPAESRVTLFSIWEMLAFLLNAVCFVFIGLEAPHLLRAADGSGWWPVLGGMAIGGVVILARLVWTFPGAYLPPLLSPAVRRREGGIPSWRHVLLVSWCGMRGVVSLAAALALPRGGDGAPGFPGRDLIIFITVMVIVATLVVQGVTLLPLVRLLGIREDDAGDVELRRAREAVLAAGIDRLDAYCSEVSCPVAVHHLRQAMADRLASFRAEDEAERGLAAHRLAVSHEVQEAVRGAQSSRLLALRDGGDINDNTYLERLLEVDRGGLT